MSATARALLGRAFIHPAVDYAIIGGGWSMLATAVLLYRPSLTTRLEPAVLASLILIVNSSHFAASTVRLYSRPRALRELPFLTMTFPLVALLGLTASVAYPELLGRHLQALYLTWSPFHYAAQTYGLAAMYCHISEVRLSARDRWLLWLACMAPFTRSFLGAQSSGLGWFVSRESLVALPLVPQALGALTLLLLVLTFVLPFVLALRVYQGGRQALPLTVVLLMVSNGLWWTALDALGAFVLATIAHGLQYLAIVLVYHVRDRVREPGNRHGWLFHAATFYGTCLGLGYALFYCWPWAFVWAGAGLAESMLMVVATINVHHFVVDRYIWRSRSVSNARTLAEAASAA